MLTNQFVVKQKKARFLMPRTYHKSNPHGKGKYGIMDCFTPQMKPQRTPKKIELSLPALNSYQNSSNRESNLVDKSVGSMTPLFFYSKPLPKVLKTFENYQSKQVETIHSFRSRCKSQKLLPHQQIPNSGKCYTQHPAFRGIMVGHKFNL